MTKLLSILLGASFLFSIQTAQSRELLAIGCEGTSVERTAVIENEIFSFDAQEPTSEFIQEAVQKQVAYMAAYFANTQEPSTFRIVFNKQRLKIRTQTITRAPYPFTLKIDTIRHPAAVIQSSYVKSALKLKQIKKGRSGWKISYTAELPAAYCGIQPSEEPPKSIQTFAPHDPFLAYWMVSPQNRRQIRWRESSFKINPCAASELADIPHPEFYWYFWNPIRTGSDAHGRSFNCKTMNGLSQFYGAVSLNLTEGRRLQTDRETFHKSIRSEPITKILVLHGIIDPAAQRFDRGQLVSAISHLERVSSLRESQEKLAEKNPSKIDRSSVVFLRLIEKLFSSLRNPKFDVDPSYQQKTSPLLIKLTGELPKSGKKIEMKLFYGLTDLLGSEPPQHLAAIAEDLAHSTFVLYTGHSGLGVNFKRETFENALGQKMTQIEQGIRQLPYQFYGFFGCFTNSYFGDDWAQLRLNKTTDVMTNGIEAGNERGPLGILAALDQYLDSDKTFDLSKVEPFRPSDFLIFERN